jgi:hypothetical protein
MLSGRRLDMREIILWGGTGQARVLNECLFGTDNRFVAVLDSTRSELINSFALTIRS